MTIFDGLSLLRLDFEVSWCTRRGRVFLWRLVCDAFRRGGRRGGNPVGVHDARHRRMTESCVSCFAHFLCTTTMHDHGHE
jgi:hypothetical protein